MLVFKKGVTCYGLQPEMLRALDKATAIFAEHNRDCVCTSARGGRHGMHSHHYKGLAIDLRTRHLPDPISNGVTIAAELRESLGDEYQVINEDTHIHIEYDPSHKEAYPQ